VYFLSIYHGCGQKKSQNLPQIFIFKNVAKNVSHN
jgi:hypothetical protein